MIFLFFFHHTFIAKIMSVNLSCSYRLLEKNFGSEQDLLWCWVAGPPQNQKRLWVDDLFLRHDSGTHRRHLVWESIVIYMKLDELSVFRSYDYQHAVFYRCFLPCSSRATRHCRNLWCVEIGWSCSFLVLGRSSSESMTFSKWSSSSAALVGCPSSTPPLRRSRKSIMFMKLDDDLSFRFPYQQHTTTTSDSSHSPSSSCCSRTTRYWNLWFVVESSWVLGSWLVLGRSSSESMLIVWSIRLSSSCCSSSGVRHPWL